jgi:CHAT domain-containing protein/tetratricopeptide (TPR) repeat protein
MKTLFLLSVLLVALSAQSQNAFQKLKGKVQTTTLKAKSEVQKGASKLGTQLEKVRDSFDSVDFDYAILLTDNSGTFDVREKGEMGATFASWASMGTSLIDTVQSDGSEKARFQLEAGEVFYGLKKYAFADKRYTSAINLYEQAGLTDDIGFMKALANKGLLYNTMGRFTQAQEFTLMALEKRKAKLGADNIGVASSYNNSGVLSFNLGHYNEADKDLSKALAIIVPKAPGSMPHAILLNNKAMVYQTIGRYDDAEKLMNEAIGIVEKMLDSKSKNRFKFISNLALLYRYTGKFTEAEMLYAKMEKDMGKGPDLASLYNNQAMLYMAMGKDDKVEGLFKKSIAMFKESLGAEGQPSAKVMNNLGNYYRTKGKFGDADKMLQQSKNIYERVLGPNHPLFVQTQEDIAILYWKQKQNDKAYPLYNEVMTKSLEFIHRYFPPMSEAEKTKYWDVLSQRFQRFYNFGSEIAGENQKVLTDMFDYQMATKALLLNSTNKIKMTILSSKDTALIRIYTNWLDQKETLARLYAYSKDELKEQKINLDSIETAANTTEKKLSQLSKDFSAGYSTEDPTFAQVRNLLTPEEALVEIVHVKKFDQTFTKESKYFAMVATKENEFPKLVVIENGNELDTRYAKFYKNAIIKQIADEYSYDQYWAPIEPLVAGKKTIYLSPDGAYSQININTIKKPGGDFLLNRYDVSVVGNSKDLVASKDPKKTALSKNAFLLGFPDFGGNTLAALPGTKGEVDGIGKILKTSGYKTNQVTDKLATEKSVKLLKGNQIVHIATHGYFLPDSELHEGNTIGVSFENAKDNPLLRSGLILTGGATTMSGNTTPDLQSNDNGILTAYEAMNLSLDGTDLIILSACETGLGEVRAGEGVYGLQRAFMVAGAKTLIMSLWKVDDAATQLLMTSFYSNLVKGGTKQNAFKQAQLALMTKYKDPYYWGAFVMMGI